MQGKCLCGAIAVTAETKNESWVCHCSMCRRWAGGPLFTVSCGSNVQFSGKPTIFRSSDWAERGFCAACGTHLFYHLLHNDEYILAAGLFQDQTFQLTTEIYIEEKPDFYEFKNATHKLTGQQILDQFAPKN